LRPVRGGESQNIAITFGTEKLEWCGYPTVQKIRKIMFIHFDRILMGERIDGHRTIGHAYASRGKNFRPIFDRKRI